MTYGDRVLDWLLRHRHDAVPLGDHDLVLVREHPALADTSEEALLRGEPWRVAHVSGELTLRAVLPEGGRLVAVVPQGFLAPDDLGGRAWFGRPLDVQARDLVAAAARRPCAPVLDDALDAAVAAHWPALRDQAPGWSAEGPVSAREVRDVLLAVQLGTAARLDRVRPEDLLARWLVDGPPGGADGLLGAALADAHGREGRWLAWALGVSDGLDLLVTAGALAAALDVPSDLADRVPGIAKPHDRLALGRLVELAVRQALATGRGEVLARLHTAEAWAATLPAEQAERFPLLRGPLVAAIRWHLAEAAAGQPAADARIEALTGNVHARELAPAVELARAAARLARFVAAAPVAEGARGWVERARGDVAWADGALRELRRRSAEVPPELAALAAQVQERFVAHRDALNAAFATWLAGAWPAVSAGKDVGVLLPLHQVTRCLVRPLVDAGHRVLLVVLDGCDVSTLVEACTRLPVDAGFGVGLPRLRDPQLVDDLQASGGFGLAVAPLPTVTSHARRALFAGEIPGASSLTDTEQAAANAKADHAAFAANPALGPVRRTLLLKGEVEKRPEAVRAALDDDHQLVAVVFNGVDDALSSKETAPFAPWTFAGVGGDLLATLRHALAQDWVVLVTADHGHTPFVGAGRKVATSALGNRYGTSELPGAVRFDAGPLPSKPLWALTAFGAWAGTQHRGWHGGAAIEEVLVPLAFLTRCGPGEGRPSAPVWWWRRHDAVSATSAQPVPPPVSLPKAPVQAPPPVEAPPPIPAVVQPGDGPSWAQAIDDPDLRRVLVHLDRHGAVDHQDLLSMLGSDRKARRFADAWEKHVAVLPFGIRVDMLGGGMKRYVKEP